MASKVDGVIEAVRYTADGRIALVRGYERRGAIFSDYVLISRDRLVEQLQKGKKFFTGTRRKFFAGTFETRASVMLVKKDGKEWVATGKDAARDQLDDVPLF
jgi:hypothetical protein